MKKEKIIIFTDGASKGNPGPGGWGAVVVDSAGGVDSKVFELGGGERHTTNNRMEIMAVIGALSYVCENLLLQIKPKNEAIVVYLDSSYVLKGVTKWISGWQENGWITKNKKEVLNRDLWERLQSLVTTISDDLVEIDWQLLSGHVGIAGNERADEIATGFADVADGSTTDRGPKLFSGSRADHKKEHGFDILDIAHDDGKKIIKNAKSAKKKDRAHSKVKAYSYVSMVKGEIKTHQTWAECEKRVKGVSNAKFKKATSVEEEREIIESW